MLVVGLGIAMVWAALLGTAYVVRFRVGASFGLSIAAVSVCYLALVLAALVFIGLGARGALASAGMLMPLSVSIVLLSLR